jgi:hypothetical protein
MANFYGQTRSNYFAVKDPEAFKQELSKYPVEIITQEKDGVTLYGFLDNDPNGGGQIDYYYDEEAEENSEDISWGEFFKRHLEDDWVAIIVSSGAEKYRYIAGHATAYNNKGEGVHLDLSDIISLSSHLGSKTTVAEY